jgi:hypothetical protein
MRLKQLIESNEAPLFTTFARSDEEILEGAERVRQFILAECKPYLEQKREDAVLFRGMKSRNSHNVAVIKNVMQDRTPRDSTNIQNMFFIDLIAHKGYKANRNNSTFTSTSKNKAEGFGEEHMFFPIGDFHFTWGYNDMTEQISESDIPLYNLYSRKAYEEAAAKVSAAEAVYNNLPKADHPDAWTEVSPENKKKLQQAAADLNIWPGYEARKTFDKLSPSEQHAWDWHACKGFLDKLKGDTDSTLKEAMGERGEIMISCKQYVAIKTHFYSNYIDPLI